MSIKVLLIWPNSRNEVLGWGDLGAVAEPLALEYLAASLRQAGHEVSLLDMRLDPNGLNTRLDEFCPDLIGITAFSMHVIRALQISRLCKSRLEGVRTIAGGCHATFRPHDFLPGDFDYVVSGDGIKIIADVAAHIDCGAPLPRTKGLYRINRQRNGYEGSGKATLSHAEFKQILQPDREITRGSRHRYFIDDMKPVALLRTTMGCPYRCTFCSIWTAVDGHYLIQDIDNVVHELRSIPENNVFLVDDEAFINARRMLKLAQAIKDAGIKKRYFTYCRIDTLLKNVEAIKAWRDIGLRRLFIGIDAISSKDLDEYHKKCEIAQIEEGLDLAKQLGIEIFAQFVVNTDYSKTDFRALERFIKHHGVDYPSFTVLTPLPGTALLTPDNVVQCQENGDPNWELFDCQNAVTQTTLPADVFRKEYRGLYKTFKGAYTRYREHNSIIKEFSAQDALRSGHPTSAMKARNPII